MSEKPEAKKFDHSRFSDIFEGQNDFEDVSLESALSASAKPDTKTVKVEVLDTELGWVEEWTNAEPQTSAPVADEPETFYEKKLNASLDAPILTAAVRVGKVVREFVYQKQGDYRTSGAPWGLIDLTVDELQTRGFKKRAEYEF